MKAKKLLKSIDWSELRNQKKTLLEISKQKRKSIDINWNSSDEEQMNNIEGLLNLIDNIQDYAVDELGIDEKHIFDFEEEEEREHN